jgi:hypothetical protein
MFNTAKNKKNIETNKRMYVRKKNKKEKEKMEN